MNLNLRPAKKCFVALPLIAFLAAQACSGQSPVSVFDNLWNINTDPNSSSSRIPFGRDVNNQIVWFAQGFHTGDNAGGYYLNSATLAFDNAFGQPASFTLDIFNTTANRAPNASLGQLTGSSDPDIRGNYLYSAQDLLLQPGSDYAMVVKAAGTVSVQNDQYLWYRSASTSITAADGWQAAGMWGWIEQPSIWGSTYPSHTWFSSFVGYPPAAFSLTVTPVPEPGSFALLIASAPLLLRRVRRRVAGR